MSWENEDLLRHWIAEFATPAGVAAVANGEIDLSRYWDTDAVVVNFSEGPLTKPYRGLRGVREWVDESLSEVDDPWLELGKVLESGPDHVVANVRFHGTMHLSGIPFDVALAVLFRFRRGKIVYCQGFLEADAALEAVGLSG